MKKHLSNTRACAARPSLNAISAAIQRLQIEAAVSAALALCLVTPVQAAPEGGSVVAGQAQVGRSGNLTTIVQQSNRAVIDWRSFSVGASEAVNFRQPDASAVTLNRVTGADPSSILGHITANGRVYLVNPNGILFGQGAQVNVGGLVASTANVSNANFMAGNDRFDQPGRADAKVENQGTLRIADAGIAALVGRRVANSGFIVASLGKVALAAGDAFVLDFTGDRLVSFILDSTRLEQLQDAQGVSLAARVDNTGNIYANGGRVQLSAATVSSLLNNVINVQGDIRATTLNAQNGVISLWGNATTDVTLGGVLQASGTNANTRASMSASGRDITVASTAQIDQGLGASLSLTAGRDIAINAPINALRPTGTAGATAGGTLTAVANRNLTANQTLALNNANLSLTATNGTLSSAAGTVLDAGTGAVTLVGGAGVAIERVQTSGAVDIRSASGSVSLARALVATSSGSTAAPVASLLVRAGQGVSLNGVLATGSVDVVSTSGAITTNTAAIEAGGPVTLNAGTTLTVGSAGIESTGAGQPITLSAGGNVLLNGDVQANNATISVTSRGGAVTAYVNKAWENPVAPGTVVDQNSRAEDAVIDAGNDASTARVVVASRGAAGQGGVTLGGIKAGASVVVTSDNGNVTLLSPLGGTNTGYDQYDDGYQTALRPDVGTLRVVASNGSVELNGLNLDGLADPRGTGNGLSVTASQMILSNSTIAVNKGDIVLAGGTRAETTDGVYLGASVFSRGWDWVGNDRARDGTGDNADVKLGYGISVTGRNLGLFDNNSDVAELPGLFRVTPTTGPAVYTDADAYVVNTDGSRERNLDGTYQRVMVTIPAGRTAANVSLAALDAAVVSVQAEANPNAPFDSDSALQPLLGEAVKRTLGKIEIANNVANYRDQLDRLQPLTTAAPPLVSLDVASIGGVTNAVPSESAAGNGGRQSIIAFAPLMGALSNAPVLFNASNPSIAATRGIVLKLLGFDGAQDLSTELWNTVVDLNDTGVRLANSGLLIPSFGYPNPGFAAGISNISTPVGGVFSAQLGTRTLQLRRLPPPLSGFAYVVSDQFTDANGVLQTTPIADGDNSIYQIRFGRSDLGRGSAFVSEPGRATGVSVRGTLLGFASPAEGLVLSSLAAPTLGFISPGVLQTGFLPLFVRPNDAATAYTVRVSGGSSPRAPSYALGKVVVDSSTSGTYGADARGTRVALFDGILDTQLGRATVDGSGTSGFVPGFGGIGGNNNSTTTFTSVGGTVPVVTAGPPSQNGAGTGTATLPPAGNSFVATPDGNDRAMVDVQRSADAPLGLSTESVSIEVGQRPASQADMGRGAGVPGAAHNVFKRRYRLATSTDNVVCAPGAVEPEANATGARVCSP